MRDYGEAFCEDSYTVTDDTYERPSGLLAWLNTHGDHFSGGVDATVEGHVSRFFTPRHDPHARVMVYPGDVLVRHPDGSIKVRRHDP